ncbi:hypothetical protein NUW58_g3800 [Xylaria curta]|uniref:Uncharacterized protein n=1 Tax=Xylaria curta TaxID=42375 RepID=A0ACC1P9D2_9PEZI|nr:hypothetical protein NUW58_g3800 [Xylaria curta]
MPSETVLVTNCSAGGIGAATALALAQRRHHVFTTARSIQKIPADLSGLSNVTLIPLDVTSSESVAAAAQTVAASGRGLDVLVNNAGVDYAMLVLDVDISRAKKVYEVNIFNTE